MSRRVNPDFLNFFRDIRDCVEGVGGSEGERLVSLLAAVASRSEPERDEEEDKDYGGADTNSEHNPQPKTKN